MKHVKFATMTNAGPSLGQYSVDPARYGSFQSGRPKSSRLLSIIGHWLNRQRQRQDLSKLDHRMLKDIGLTSFDVDREVEKPFWRP